MPTDIENDKRLAKLAEDEAKAKAEAEANAASVSVEPMAEEASDDLGNAA